MQEQAIGTFWGKVQFFPQLPHFEIPENEMQSKKKKIVAKQAGYLWAENQKNEWTFCAVITIVHINDIIYNAI